VLAADHPGPGRPRGPRRDPRAPGAVPSPPLFVPAPINNRPWHAPFNRVDKLPEQLVEGRKDVFLGYEFAIQGGNLPDDVVTYYVRMLSNPDGLRGPRSSSSSCSPASLPARS
jgi:hypothetical protein